MAFLIFRNRSLQIHSESKLNGDCSVKTKSIIIKLCGDYTQIIGIFQAINRIYSILGANKTTATQ
jgi:hypothetical protein